MHFCSSHFAVFRTRRRRVPSRIEHGMDEFEHGALIRGRQLFNALQPFQQSRCFRRECIRDRLRAEQRIRRDMQRAREIDEERAGGSVLSVS